MKRRDETPAQASPSHGGASDTDRGLNDHERFLVALEDEVVRSRYFRRPLSVLVVRASNPAALRSGDWKAYVKSLLRPVDRVASYGADALQILLPECGAEGALKVANAIAAPRGDDDRTLLVGLAVFPDGHATDAGSLFEESLSAAYRADPTAPVQRANAHPARAENELWLDEAEVLVASAKMRRLVKDAQRVASSPLTVLLLGETGTGKEVIARTIHNASRRRGAPMLVVNCGAIPDQLLESTLFGHVRGAFTGAIQDRSGVFEAADGGTVLLDEIGELPLAAQAALLRVLETKRITRIGSTKEIPVDVRVVASTHRDLEAMTERGAFRQDLLFRLNAIQIALPPLRDRIEEIEPLALHFLQRTAQTSGAHVRGIKQSALTLLKSYSWPGNIRELRNAMERAVVITQGDMVSEEDLPERVRSAASSAATVWHFHSHGSHGEQTQEPTHALSAVLRELADAQTRCIAPTDRLRSALRDATAERHWSSRSISWQDLLHQEQSLRERFLVVVLDACGWNLSRASRQLNIHRTQLRREVQRLGLTPHHGDERGGSASSEAAEDEKEPGGS